MIINRNFFLKKSILLTIFFAIFLNPSQIYDNYISNYHMIVAHKQIFQKEVLNYQLNGLKFNISNPCRTTWIKLITEFYNNGKRKNTQQLKSIMECGEIYADMIKSLEPDDSNLSEYAKNIYPGSFEIMKWYAESVSKVSLPKAEEEYFSILEIWPNNGEIWRALAVIHQSQGKINQAINDNQKSCINGDPHFSGCYNVGELLSSLGRYKEALYYYRLSNWEFSHRKADRLESQLASGELTP